MLSPSLVGLWVCFVISLNGSRMVLVLSMRKGALVLQASDRGLEALLHT
jgi:hypothetical protein